MICNLSPEAFCTFGSIPGKTERPLRANNHSVSLSPHSTWTYRAGSKTWVAGESGVTVLSVSEDGEDYRDFFLDRPVILHDGIWFRLSPFRGTASVQVAAVLLPSLEHTGPTGEQFVATPTVQVERIYALFYQEKEAGFLFPGESHPMAELVYVDAGSMHSVVEGQDILLEQGDMMLYSPGQWHMQYAQPACAPRIISVTFDAAGMDYGSLTDRKFSHPQQETLLLRQMLREQERMDEQATDMIISLLTLLLLHLQRQSGQRTAPAQLPHNYQNENEIIRRAQQYIGQNVCSKLSVPVVAAGIEVSASYLTALFQKHLQITPAEYIRRTKLQHSKQLIREGNMNFTQIAQALQYSTVHHFSRQFKEKFGITPTEYARTVR